MTFSCPKCNYQNAKGSLQCLSCLLVFEIHNKKTSGLVQQVKAPASLALLWDAVITDYGNKDVHERFIQASLAQKNLAYASQQYRQMVEISPLDDIALKMRDRIIHLATVTFVPPARPQLSKNSRWGYKIFIFVLFFVGLVLVLQVFLK